MEKKGTKMKRKDVDIMLGISDDVNSHILEHGGSADLVNGHNAFRVEASEFMSGNEESIGFDGLSLKYSLAVAMSIVILFGSKKHKFSAGTLVTAMASYIFDPNNVVGDMTIVEAHFGIMSDLGMPNNIKKDHEETKKFIFGGDVKNLTKGVATYLVWLNDKRVQSDIEKLKENTMMEHGQINFLK